METIIDVINATSNGIIECRQSTTDDNGNISFFRWTLYPGQDISNQDQKVQQVCNQTWTQEVISAYENETKINQI